jgi:hypothetical protein
VWAPVHPVARATTICGEAGGDVPSDSNLRSSCAQAPRAVIAEMQGAREVVRLAEPEPESRFARVGAARRGPQASAQRDADRQRCAPDVASGKEHRYARSSFGCAERSRVGAGCSRVGAWCFRVGAECSRVGA